MTCPQARHQTFFFHLRNGTRGRLRRCPAGWTVENAQMVLERLELDWKDVWTLDNRDRLHSNLVQVKSQKSAQATIEIWVGGKNEESQL